MDQSKIKALADRCEAACPCPKPVKQTTAGASVFTWLAVINHLQALYAKDAAKGLQAATDIRDIFSDAVTEFSK